MTQPTFISMKDRARLMLQNRTVKQTYEGIAAASGANVDWIKRFARGATQIDDADNVQRLYEYFTGTPTLTA